MLQVYAFKLPLSSFLKLQLAENAARMLTGVGCRDHLTFDPSTLASNLLPSTI